MAFCDGPLWDWKLSWNTSAPDLTPCFQDTVLVWIPCVFFMVFAFLELLVQRERGIRLPWTAFNITKIVLCLFLCLVQVIDLISLVRMEHQPIPYQIWSPIVQFSTLMFSLAMTFYKKSRGQVSSPSLWAFWLLYSVSTFMRYRSVMMLALQGGHSHQFDPVSSFRFVLRVSAFPVSFAQFILHCFADRRSSEFARSAAKRSAERDASFLSTLVFWWFNGMAALGYKRARQGSGLQLDDMWQLDEENTTDGVMRRFQPNYEKEVAKKKPRHSTQDESPVMENQLNVFHALVRTFGWQILGAMFIKFITSLLTFIPPTILNWLITYMDSNDPVWHGIFFAFLMLLSSMTESLLNGQYEYRISRIAMRVRAALIRTIYIKALKLNGLSRSRFTTGEIVNLMAVDTQRIMDQMNMMNMLWAIPLQIGIAIYLLWQQLGAATIGGLVVMIVLIPINAVVTVFLRRTQAKLMKDKDGRTKLMNEALAGVRILKLYAWEPAFIRQIDALRDKELASLRRQAWLGGFMVLAFTSAPFLVALASFVSYVLADPLNVLDANKAFVSLSLFNILRGPMAMLPMIIAFTAMFFVSLNRVNRYLRSEELDPDAVQHINGSDQAVSIEDGSFQYAKEAERPTLLNINMNIKRGQLIAVVGTVGSGKSTLFGAMLGDLFKKSGNVTVSGTVAYVPQQAWIQGTTLRNNIIFGQKFDRARYEQVIDACSLQADLDVLPAGDKTHIGEKGINLSGGQKQRISLARALYSQADIYYLDDPLSAVDSHVSKHIFETVISNEGILASKTRILVTHRLSVLEHCDAIYVLKEGEIFEKGTYRQLISRKGAFADFLVQHLLKKSDISEIPDDDLKLIETIVKEGDATPQLVRQISKISGSDTDSKTEAVSLRRRASNSRSNSTSSISQSSGSAAAKLRLNTEAMITTEETQSGSVKWRVYQSYASAMGYVKVIFTIIAFITAITFNMISSIWLSEWSADAADPRFANDTSQRDYRISLYAAWGVGETAFAIIACISLNLLALRGGQALHKNMLSRVLHAPMAFFDSTPIGRILNRFSKDIDTADTSVRFNLRIVIQQTLRATASFILIFIQTPWFLLMVLPIGIIYYFVQRYYIATSRQLKRIESTSRSPVFVHFSETITGCTSIRAFGAEQRFVDLSNMKTDNNHSAYYPSLAASRWLSVRLECLGYIIVFTSTILAVLARDSLTPGLAGLSISYALTVTATLNMLVKATSDLETNFVSIERCLEYSEIATESPWVIESNRPGSDWPENGAIEFHNFSTRYRPDLPLVVKNVNIQLAPGEKVGVVGRTGAGKSSLVLSLFRLVEGYEGYILIDSVDISKIGLHDLRSRLTIIPQDPVLFMGTLRKNLDPLSERSDDALWSAIEQSHLKSFVSGLDKGLEFEVTEGGENISLGQRQLVCLARALLRKTKILILDEATAAVDMETDSLIQETLKKEFSDATTLTIAHRLNTILNCDRVVVLSEGRVVENDNPQSLLLDKETIFYSMARDAGLV